MEITTYVRGIDRVADGMGLVAKPVAPLLREYDLPGGGVNMAALLDSLTPEMFTPRPLDHATEPLPQDGAYLTTNHTTSSHGLPVLIKRGQAFGPGDLPGLTLYVTPDQAERFGAVLTSAGWTWHTDTPVAESDR